MKKIISLLFIASIAIASTAFADTPAPVGDQVVAALTQHATFAIEYRHGSKNLVLSDNVIEVGRLKGDYLFAADVGLAGSTLPDQSSSSIQWTSGVRLNLHALVKNYVPLKSEWQFLNHFEYYGRGFYDFTRQAWYGSFNVGYGFGPGTAQ